MQLHEMCATRLTVRWLGVQRYDRCVSETEKQKADCEYLMFGPKVLTVVALLMVATARVGLKTGCLKSYFTMQQPDFFAKYAAVVFETAASRRSLGTAIMKFGTKMLQPQRAGEDTGNGDAATATALEQQNHGTDKGDASPDGQKQRPPQPPQDGPPARSGQPAPKKQAPAEEAAPTQTAPKPAQDGQEPGTKPQRSCNSAAPKAGSIRSRGAGGGTRGGGEEEEVGAASKKPAFRKGFSHEIVTELLADKVSFSMTPLKRFLGRVSCNWTKNIFWRSMRQRMTGAKRPHGSK